MDTSETYIKMCEKAEELQKGHYIPTGMGDKDGRIRAGDDIFQLINGGSIYLRNCLGQIHPENYVWLPRQDQLQEIVFGEDLMRGDVGYPLFRISRFESKGGYNAFSMEQLWLAFVMKERYKKIWSGTDWVKEAVKAQ